MESAFRKNCLHFSDHKSFISAHFLASFMTDENGQRVFSCNCKSMLSELDLTKVDAKGVSLMLCLFSDFNHFPQSERLDFLRKVIESLKKPTSLSIQLFGGENRMKLSHYLTTRYQTYDFLQDLEEMLYETIHPRIFSEVESNCKIAFVKQNYQRFAIFYFRNI